MREANLAVVKIFGGIHAEQACRMQWRSAATHLSEMAVGHPRFRRASVQPVVLDADEQSGADPLRGGGFSSFKAGGRSASKVSRVKRQTAAGNLEAILAMQAQLAQLAAQISQLVAVGRMAAAG